MTRAKSKKKVAFVIHAELVEYLRETGSAEVVDVKIVEVVEE